MQNRAWLLGLIALLFLTGCAGKAPATSEEPREVKTYPIDDFLDTVSFGGSSFSPDGTKLLVSSDETGIRNAYALPVDGSEPIQLTNSTVESVRTRSYFPADERFLFQSDRGGNERDHVYVRELDGSEVDLTPGGELKATFAGWAQDDQTFFIASNERDPRYFDVYEYQVDGYERELFYKETRGFQVQSISPDKRYVALGKPRTTNDSDIYLFDRTTEELTHLSPHEGDASYGIADFHPDGKSLLYTTNEGGEFSRLMRYELADGRHEEVMAPSWDVVAASYSETGKYLVVFINNDAKTEVQVIETASNKRIDLPLRAAADISSLGIDRGEKHIAFYMSRSRNPRDLFVWEIGGGEPRQLTRSLNPNINPEDLVDPQVVRFESYDGVTIPGVLYKPHGADADHKSPALVWVHGGPGGQSRVGYSDLIQYLVNHGYVVYAINNRGSSGYGKTFYAMDDQRHGEADLDDCVASKQMLIDTGYVDPDRIGIIGGSYGGYMTLAALAFRPEEFTAGVDIFGVANWPRTLESIPPWWESFREALYAEMGDPVEDKERLHRISPVFHAGNITKPLMVLQGANDPRVLKAESDDMVQAARDNGATVEYVVFDDEGHGFAKKENQRRGYKAIREFLDVHLAGRATVEDSASVGGEGSKVAGGA